MVVFTHKTNSC